MICLKCKKITTEGATNRITNEMYCIKCLNKKFEKEGTPFSHFKRIILNLFEAYPFTLTEERVLA